MLCYVYELYFLYTNRKRSIRLLLLLWDRISSTIEVICVPYIDIRMLVFNRQYSIATLFSYRQVAVLLFVADGFCLLYICYLIFVPFCWHFSVAGYLLNRILNHIIYLFYLFSITCARIQCTHAVLYSFCVSRSAHELQSPLTFFHTLSFKNDRLIFTWTCIFLCAADYLLLIKRYK